MYQKIKSIFLAGLPAIVIATFLVAVVIYAWTEPTSAPPSGNVSAPLNVGNIGQDKSGALRIGGVFQTDDAAFLARYGGNVGIGTTGPNSLLSLQSASPQITLHDTGDTNAGIKWETSTGANPAFLRYDYAGNGWLNFSGRAGINITTGNVGIGTASPGQKLEVAGNMKISGVGNGIIFPDGSVQASAASISKVLPAPISTGGNAAGEPNVRDANPATAWGFAFTASPNQSDSGWAVYDLGSSGVRVITFTPSGGTGGCGYSFVYLYNDNNNPPTTQISSSNVLMSGGGGSMLVGSGRYLKVSIGAGTDGGCWARASLGDVIVQ